MDRGAWRATVRWIAKSWTQPSMSLHPWFQNSPWCSTKPCAQTQWLTHKHPPLASELSASPPPPRVAWLRGFPECCPCGALQGRWLSLQNPPHAFQVPGQGYLPKVSAWGRAEPASLVAWLLVVRSGAISGGAWGQGTRPIYKLRGWSMLI